MERWVKIILSPTLCTWCTHGSTGVVPTGECRMVSGRPTGMRTGGGWTGMSGVVRQGGDRTHGSCCGGRTSWGGRDLIQLRPYERGAYSRNTTCGSRTTDPSVAAGRESDARTEWCRSAEPGGREEGGRSHAGGAVMADRVVAVRREPDGWAWWAGRRGRAVGELQTGCRAAEYGGCRPGGERSGGVSGGQGVGMVL